jgi:hypothetical protein
LLTTNVTGRLVQKLDWLGYTWDTENGIIFVKEERIQKLEKCLTYALCQAEKGQIMESAGKLL